LSYLPTHVHTERGLRGVVGVCEVHERRDVFHIAPPNHWVIHWADGVNCEAALIYISGSNTKYLTGIALNNSTAIRSLTFSTVLTFLISGPFFGIFKNAE
jgi:hypothetical protein